MVVCGGVKEFRRRLHYGIWVWFRDPIEVCGGSPRPKCMIPVSDVVVILLCRSICVSTTTIARGAKKVQLNLVFGFQRDTI